MRGLGTVSLLACLATACGSGPMGVRTPPEPSQGHASPPATPAPRPGTPSATPSSPMVPPSAVPRTGSTPSAVASALVTTPPAVSAPCGVADVGITTTTDARSYGTGQTVTVSVVVRNLARHGCVFAAPGIFHVVDAGENAVFAVRLECPPAGCPPLAPGQRSLYPIPWDQRANQGAGAGAQVPPGTYHAEAAFQGYPASRSAPFGIA
jgi:hypothetical protein